MKKNMGTTDKLLRVVLAVVVAFLYLTDVINGTLAVVLGILAVVFVLTGFVGYCPLYAPFGINTCPKKTK